MNRFDRSLSAWLARPRLKKLIISRVELYRQSHALDYCGNLAHIVASRILVARWRRANSHYFGDRCDRGRNQACYRSGGVGVATPQGTPREFSSHERRPPYCLFILFVCPFYLIASN